MTDLRSFLGNAGRVHLIGCAGVGTLPLARIFLENGFRVSGSDLLDTPSLQKLRDAGAKIYTGHSAGNLPPDDGTPLLVIFTSAAEDDNPELAAVRLYKNTMILRRGEALAALLSFYVRPVTVSGSHGKTSISGMLAFLFSQSGADPGYLVGGFFTGLDDRNGSAGKGYDLFISEVDESDGTHTLVSSYLGIVPNVEDDHAWSVGGEEKLYENFRQYAFQAKHLIYIASPVTDRLFRDHPDALRMDPVPDENTLSLFDAAALKHWGVWQCQDAMLALATAEKLGMDRTFAAKILSRFPGMERRMTVRFENGKFTLIEDYAHHPTELHCSIETLRSIYPGRRLVVFFQPHRYARLERYFDRFAEELFVPDRVFITPVFSAWTSIGKYDSADLVNAIGETATLVTGTWQDAALAYADDCREKDLVAVIGAGDVKDILPYLQEILENR